MTTLTVRMNEAEAETVRHFAASKGVSVSDLLRCAVLEKIEDSQDIADLRKAIAQDDGQRYTLAEVRSKIFSTP